MAEENTNNDLESLRQEILAKLEGLEKGQAIVQKMNEEDLLALKGLSAEKTREQIGIILTEKQESNTDSQPETSQQEPTKNSDTQKNNEPLNVDEEINSITVNEIQDEKPQETDQNEDWRARVRAKEKEANQELGNNFQEVETNDKSAPLTFKDDKGNTHEFSDENHCRVAGDQTAFDQLARTAKKLGKDAINFGEFKEHPEYRTRLYLACLKEGLQPTGNIPSNEEVENSPEAKEIVKELIKKNRKELRQELNASRKALATTQAAWKNDPDYSTLTTAYNTAWEAHKNSPSESTKNTLEQAEQNLNKNPAYQNYSSAKDQYKETLNKATEFYLQYGSEKDAHQTREQREDRLRTHLNNYNPKEFFKDKQGNKLKNYQQQVKQHQLRYNIMKAASRQI